MSIHEDHRKRVKERFLREGLENFDELYVLEMLLFYCVPRKDTNELAHRLLDRFGSVTAALKASPEALAQVEGVGQGITTFFSFLNQMNRYCAIREAEKETVLKTSTDCCRYIQPFFKGRKNETVMVLCLDAKCKVLECRQICEGGVNSTNVSVRKIVDIALRANASALILAHNHPGGVLMPSVEDIETTKTIAAALKGVELVLVDHILCTENDAVSLVAAGYVKL